MDPKQLELDFEDIPSITTNHKTSVVVDLTYFLKKREAQALQAARAPLVRAILDSVEHIRGDNFDAEAM